MNPKAKTSTDPKSNALSDFIRVSTIKPAAPKPCLPSKSITTFRHFQEFKNLYAQINSNQPLPGSASYSQHSNNVVKKYTNKTLVTPTTIAMEMPMTGCDTAIIAPPLKSLKSAETPIEKKKKVEGKKPEQQTLEKLNEMEYRVEKSNFLDEKFMDISIAQQQLEEINKLLSRHGSKSLTRIPSKNLKKETKLPSWNPTSKLQRQPSNTSQSAPVDKQKKVMDTLNELNDRLREMQDKYFSGVHIKYKTVDKSLEEIKQSISKEVDKFDLVAPQTPKEPETNVDKEIEELEKKLNELKRVKQLEETKLKDNMKLSDLDIDVDHLQQKFENLKLIQENLLLENQEIKEEAKEKVEQLRHVEFSPKIVGDVEKFFNEVSVIMQEKIFSPKKSSNEMIKREFIIDEDTTFLNDSPPVIDKDDSLSGILTDMELLEDSVAVDEGYIPTERFGRKHSLYGQPTQERPTKDNSKKCDLDLDLSQLFPRHKDIVDIRLAAMKPKEALSLPVKDFDQKVVLNSKEKRKETKKVETDSKDSDKIRLKHPMRPKSPKTNKQVQEDLMMPSKTKSKIPKMQNERSSLKMFNNRLSNLKSLQSLTEITELSSSEKKLDLKRNEEVLKVCSKQNECTMNDIQLSSGTAKNASTFTSDLNYRRPPLAKSKFGNRKLESSIKDSKYLSLEFQKVFRPKSRDRSRPTSAKSGKSSSPERLSKGTNKVFIPSLSSTQT